MSKNRLSLGLKVALLWMSLASIQAIYEYGVLYNYGVVPDWFDFGALLRINLITSSISGLLAGGIFIPKINTWLRTHSYRRALFYTLIIITVSFFFVSAFGSFVFNSLKYEASFTDSQVTARVAEYLASTEHLKNYLIWLTIGLLTIIGIQIADKYGPGNFTNFLLGKYFHPKQEERIFMFLDIRSSTTIAEQLEEVQFFEFLRDFFNDVTPAILEAKGKIYQYIGDEIVVSWSLEDGFHNNNCVLVYFKIQKQLEKRRQHYQDEYGLMPSFKMGIHCGKAVTGEIGMIKRDIAYSGDVLNTAARIQSMCNQLGQDVLFSKEIAKNLRKDYPGYQIESIGEVTLKGKSNELELFKVEEK